MLLGELSALRFLAKSGMLSALERLVIMFFKKWSHPTSCDSLSDLLIDQFKVFPCTLLCFWLATMIHSFVYSINIYRAYCTKGGRLYVGEGGLPKD